MQGLMSSHLIDHCSGVHDVGFPTTAEVAAVGENGDVKRAGEEVSGDAGEGGA